MRLFLTLLICCALPPLYAQQILIPYYENKKVGLCDEKGKIVFKPKFDRMEWETGEYFITYTDLYVKDTVRSANNTIRVRDLKIVERGLLHRDKMIVSNQPYTDFEIIPNKCIVAQASLRAKDFPKNQVDKYNNIESFVSILSLEGKNLYPDNFKRIQKFDTAGVSAKNNASARYVLFGTQGLNNRYSLLVLDIDKQVISDWLIKDAVKLKVTRTDYNNKKIGFECTQEEGILKQKMVDYSSGIFKIVDLPDKPNPTEGKKGSGLGSGNQVVQETDIADRESVVAVPYNDTKDMKEDGKPYVPPPFKPFHQKVGDTLFWVTGLKVKQEIKLPESATTIYSSANGFMHYRPVIFKLHQKFGLIRNGMVGSAQYDSIVYFGKHLMIAETIDGKRRYGLFDDEGKNIIPALYDSLYNGIQWIELNVHKNAATGQYDYVLRQADEREMYQERNMNPYVKRGYDRVTVFSGGKAGVLNLKNEWLIPMQYDMIVDNSFQYTQPKESKYIILKRDGLYGITKLIPDRDLNKVMMKQTIEPVFPHLPCYVIRNYQVKGFDLVGLYDPHFEFMGFASTKGLLYFKP